MCDRPGEDLEETQAALRLRIAEQVEANLFEDLEGANIALHAMPLPNGKSIC